MNIPTHIAVSEATTC